MKSRSKWMYVALSVFTMAFCSAADRLVAEWDFSAGWPKSRYDGWVRKNARVNNGLENINLSCDVPGGYATNKIHPDLAPSEGFRLDIVFSTTGTGKKTVQVLFDNQWVNYQHPSKDPKFNRGIMAYLEWQAKENTYIPCFSLGFSGKSTVLNGEAFQNMPGKKQTLSFRYDGAGQAQYSLNGKVVKSWQTEAKCGVDPARLVTVIGDRVGGSYWPFDGKIYKVSLFAFPKKASASVQAK